MRLNEKASANLGKEAQHVLLFIEHALRSSSVDTDEAADSDDGADSDDEDVDDAEEVTVAEVTKEDVPNLGLVETALNLLCSTLHGESVSIMAHRSRSDLAIYRRREHQL